MTDKLDKYIEENRGSFDDLTPSGDMWERISQDTQKKRGLSRKLITYRISGAAAILIVALFGYNYFSTSQPQQQHMSAAYEEVLETEQYYNNKVLQKKQQIFKLTSSDPDIKTDIEAELALLDKAMLELKNDLQENISNTEVVEAMVQNYRMKLQILEDILKYIEPQQEIETEQTKISNI